MYIFSGFLFDFKGEFSKSIECYDCAIQINP